ncbi:MAG: DNA-binding domain-containing protein [Pseudomonadota bacterium]
MERVDQTQLTNAILAADRPVPEGLSDGEGRPAGKRFDVYRNNVAVSLTEALSVAFPTIHSLVGDAFFRAMAGVFVRQHPPTSPVLVLYGAEFPGFLAGFEPVAHLPYLPDVARIDQALREAYHAADATPIRPEALQLAPDALMAARMEIAPATRIIASPYAIYNIWMMSRGGGKPGTAGQGVLISRPEFDPQVDLLPAGGAAFLAALGRGVSTAQALDQAPDLDPATGLGPTLAIALGRGVITRVHAPS